MKVPSTALAAAAVVAVSSPVFAAIQYFADPNSFGLFAAAQGKTLKSIEDFEESLAPDGSKTPFPNPLQHGQPRPQFPEGIAATNLIIQTNITPGPFAAAPNPSADPQALWVNGAGFIRSNSIKVGTDEFLYGRFSSLDLIFTSHDKTAVGFDASTFEGFAQGHAGFQIGIFDDFNNLIGAGFMPPAPPEPTKAFFGVWSSVPIGRVNIWGMFSVPQPFAVDNIQMWTVPAPGAASVFALAGLIAMRRRR